MWQEFPFPTGIQIVLMKHEQEIAMKLLQTFGTKTLLYTGVVLGVVLFLTLLAQALAIAFYAAAFLVAVCAVGYLYNRLTDDPTNTTEGSESS